MKLPFVSRARFEDLQKRVLDLEEERRALLDRLLTSSGSTPVYTAPPTTAASTAKEEEKDDQKELAPPRKPRLFAVDVRRLAENLRNNSTAKVGA